MNLFKVYERSEAEAAGMNPCPICELDAGELIRTEDGLHYVQCRKCGAMTDDHKDAARAVEQWNEGRIIDAGV